ncbi:MAG TPA: hypothetical protein VFR81_22240 [Longimicrobium sp.]|nr:hypothetical protein [Longimicrobium sp.]
MSTRLPTLRVHRIDFSDPRVTERSFNVRAQSDADERAWQFALSANEHGRVHGFLVEDTFYVRWLDPDHNLYPG